MRQGGYTLTGICLAILFLAVAFGGAAYLGGNAVDTYRADALVRECDAIDSALRVWARNHRQVSPGDVEIRQDGDGKEYMFYTSGPSFPKTLQDLGEVRDDQAYFSEGIDLSKFRYATQTDADGKMTYTLEVTMPNGDHYISPLSKK